MKVHGELGRSMVEILGVLAVMGILSIGGVLGFKFAMAKYKANEIIESASVGNQKMQLAQTPRFLHIDGVEFGTKEMRVRGKNKEAFVTIQVNDAYVCEEIKRIANGPWVVEGECE